MTAIRWLVAATCVLLVISVAPAGADPTGRTVEAPYRGPSEIEAGSAVIHLGAITVYNDQVLGPVRFEPRRGERFVHLEIVDESGNAVKGHVSQRFKGGDRLIGHFCGSTVRPLEIRSGGTVRVYPGNDPCGDGVIGATQGTVIARFTK